MTLLTLVYCTVHHVPGVVCGAPISTVDAAGTCVTSGLRVDRSLASTSVQRRNAWPCNLVDHAAQSRNKKAARSCLANRILHFHLLRTNRAAAIGDQVSVLYCLPKSDVVQPTRFCFIRFCIVFAMPQGGGGGPDGAHEESILCANTCASGNCWISLTICHVSKRYLHY